MIPPPEGLIPPYLRAVCPICHADSADNVMHATPQERVKNKPFMASTNANPKKCFHFRTTEIAPLERRRLPIGNPWVRYPWRPARRPRERAHLPVHGEAAPRTAAARTAPTAAPARNRAPRGRRGGVIAPLCLTRRQRGTPGTPEAHHGSATRPAPGPHAVHTRPAPGPHPARGRAPGAGRGGRAGRCRAGARASTGAGARRPGADGHGKQGERDGGARRARGRSWVRITPPNPTDLDNCIIQQFVTS